MSRSRSSRSRALFANCFLVLRSLFRRQRYWPSTKIKRRTLGTRDAKSNPRSFFSRSPRSTLISRIWEREAKRISVWKCLPKSSCSLDAAWEVKIASFCLVKKLDLCSSPGISLPMSWFNVKKSLTNVLRSMWLVLFWALEERSQAAKGLNGDGISFICSSVGRMVAKGSKYSLNFLTESLSLPHASATSVWLEGILKHDLLMVAIRAKYTGSRASGVTSGVELLLTTASGIFTVTVHCSLNEAEG